MAETRYEDTLIALIASEAEFAIENSAREIQRIWQEARPRSRMASGAIKVPIYADIVIDGTGSHATITAKGLARAIVGGTRPHVIRPRRFGGFRAMSYAGALHPFRVAQTRGSRPHDFISPTLPDVEAALDHELGIVADNIEEKLANILQRSVDAVTIT